jgi:flagellar basal body P-ring formation protein FlgA
MNFLLLIVWLFFPPVEKTVVGSDQLQETVKAYVESSLAGKFPGINIEFRTIPRDVVFPEGEYSVKVSSSFGVPKKGYSGIPVEIRKEGRLLQTIVCSVIIRTFDNVLTTVRKVDKGEPLTMPVFEKRNMETTFLADDMIGSLKQFTHFRAKRMINKNSVLHRSMIEEIPSVVPNQIVTVVAIGVNVNVEAAGIAKDEGRIGDVIKVKRVGSKEYVSAMVVGEKRVEIIVH